MTPRLVALLLVLALASAAAADEPVVIVMSWSGVRHDYLERTPLPALTRMARDGARAERMIPVFPTNVRPNFAALATGTHVDRHGIVDDFFRDRLYGESKRSDGIAWLDAEPLWIAAERQGVKTAVLDWPGARADWRGLRPTYRKARSQEPVSESERVDSILAWLELPEPKRPQLIMSGSPGADTAGHCSPDDPRVTHALQAHDRELARLLEALDEADAWDRTTLVLVSDHGMAEVNAFVDVGQTLEVAGIEADVYPTAGSLQVFLKDGADVKDAERVLRGITHVTVHRGDALPERLRANHPTRNGDFLLTIEPPNAFYQPERMSLIMVIDPNFFGGRFGRHGYDAQHPDMATIFLALGRGVPAGARPGVVRIIDVAATVSRLLGIVPPRRSEGSPIAGLDYTEAVTPEPRSPSR